MRVLKQVQIVFKTTAILPLFEEIKLTDHGAIHLFYTQAVYNVVSSNYPCSVETAIKLAGLQLQITVGDHNPVIHRPGYLV